MKLKFIFLVALLGAFAGKAQVVNQPKLDSLFTAIESNNKGMGSIAIFHGGKNIYERSYGFASIEDQLKANTGTKYRIGSITKTFTATIIMKLVENGKLSLLDKLSKFYPQVAKSNDITIEHLLKHRSGIFNFTNATDYLEWSANYTSKEQLLSKIVSGGSVFNPDEKMGYSNSNYILLTFIAEDVSGKRFSELLNDYIAKPCALKSTYVGNKINVKNNEAYSYLKKSDWVREKETDMSIPLGAGAIVSTPNDLNIFINALFSGKIVSNESLELMKTLKDGFGLGLFHIPFYELKAYGHNGGIDGFQANLCYFPDQDVSVALTANAVDYSLNNILIGVLSIYFNKEYSIPDFKTVSITSEELDKYLGVYSSPSFPLKITISKDKNVLIAQATGQPSFPLECTEKDKFKFDQARLKMDFYPSESKMVLKQGGMEFELKKE